MSVFRCLTWTTRLDKILDEVQPGDLVCFHRGLFIHHAVFVGRGRAVHHHLGPSDGEVIEATMEYLSKGDLMKVFTVEDTPFSRSEIVQRARSQIGPLPYSLHGGNCEHFTTWVYHGVRLSKQLISLGPYQRRLLQVVKHSSPNTELEAMQQQQQQQQQTPIAGSNENEAPTTSQRDIDESDGEKCEQNDDNDDDDFVFVPPRPPKYRPAKNAAQLALNHTRSCLKVLTVQAVVRLAAVPLHRCGLQADNLRRIGRHLTGAKKRHNVTTTLNDTRVEATQTASCDVGLGCSGTGCSPSDAVTGNTELDA